MKKLLIGLLVLGSISLYGKEYDSCEHFYQVQNVKRTAMMPFMIVPSILLLEDLTTHHTSISIASEEWQLIAGITPHQGIRLIKRSQEIIEYPDTEPSKLMKRLFSNIARHTTYAEIAEIITEGNKSGDLCPFDDVTINNNI